MCKNWQGWLDRTENRRRQPCRGLGPEVLFPGIIRGGGSIREGTYRRHRGEMSARRSRLCRPLGSVFVSTGAEFGKLTRTKHVCTSTRAPNMQIPAESLMSPGHELRCQYRARHYYFAETSKGRRWRNDGKRINIARLQLREESRRGTKDCRPTRLK